MPAIEQRGDDVLLRVRVQPKASRVRYLVEKGEIKITVTAPPADGLANKMVCDKVLALLDCKLEEVREKLGV